jgi:quercetin dioxygenase-like cupin family protein
MKTANRAWNWAEIPSEVVREGVSRKGFRWKDMMMVMNECRPGMKLNPHSHTFEQLAYIVKGNAIYHVGDVGHEVGPGSFLVIPAGEIHYIEPLGTEAVLNIDFFIPAREDYMHLVEYQHDEVQAQIGEADKADRDQAVKKSA